jgi:hypothetical protein
MRVGVLGSGVVGRTLVGKMASLGHDVALGTRDVEALMKRADLGRGETRTFAEWLEQNAGVRAASFAEAAAHGNIVVNATSGDGALAALDLAGASNLDGKILVDVSNPLDFSGGFPPTFLVSNTDSLGEQIQRAVPRARVVKTLNTVNALVMVEPASIGGGDHHIFVSGNDQAAKDEVSAMLRDWFGWTHVIDLGDITTARGPEMYLALWTRVLGTVGSPAFNIKIVRELSRSRCTCGICWGRPGLPA